MIGANIKFLRNRQGLSQEQLAEKLGVTRQTVAKWECGESVPDALKCADMSVFFNVSLDVLVFFDLSNEEAEQNQADGKFIFGIVKVGERGQIVIPKCAREKYNIKQGDKLLAVGDSRGMAFAKIRGLSDINL